jgi:transcriptional regulator with XRE-family HTH domain
LFSILDVLPINRQNDEQMPAHSELGTALERQLLLQLGERLQRARQRHGLSATALAQRVGISRTTLQAVECGEPSPSIGTYLRVLAALNMAADLALVGTGEAEAGGGPVRIALGRHGPQDLQSLLMHEEAVRLIQRDPSLVERASATLERWRARGDVHTMPLWDEWGRILQRGDWAKALANTQRGRQLRQASPLATLLPEATRLRILADVKALVQDDAVAAQGEARHAAA